MKRKITKKTGLPCVREVYRERNWRELVSDFKDGPDFGIHGTRLENLRSILSNPEQTVYCHYFVAGDSEKNLPDDEFYKKLWGSILVASGFSYDFFLHDKELHFDRTPSLLLGIDNPDRPRIASGCDHYDSETFRVGHDFLGVNGIRLEGMILDVGNQYNIGRKVLRYYGNQDSSFDLARYYFGQREVIRGLMKKIHERLTQK